MSGWLALVSAAVAAAAAVTVVRAGSWRWPLPAAVAVSIAVTLVLRPPSGFVPVWTAGLLPLLVEWMGFAISIVVVVHRASPQTAALAGSAAAVAMSMMVLRLADVSSWPAVQACLMWTLAVVPAVSLGLLFRAHTRSQVRLAAEVRRGQRLQLARDLHDFVAHDVSEILATAQAGSLIGATDPARAAGLFQRIEDAGQRAMSSLDRTVEMLDDTDRDRGTDKGTDKGTGADAGPHLAGLADLVTRFDAAGPVRARLGLDPAVAGTIAPAAAAVVYRVVAEGLTNVRRHAPTASEVTVTVTRADQPWVFVTVANDVPAVETPRRRTKRESRGGRGIRGLRTLVEAAGGQLQAGPEHHEPQAAPVGQEPKAGPEHHEPQAGPKGQEPTAAPEHHTWYLIAMIPLDAAP